MRRVEVLRNGVSADDGTLRSGMRGVSVYGVMRGGTTGVDLGRFLDRRRISHVIPYLGRRGRRK